MSNTTSSAVPGTPTGFQLLAVSHEPEALIQFLIVITRPSAARRHFLTGRAIELIGTQGDDACVTANPINGSPHLTWAMRGLAPEGRSRIAPIEKEGRDTGYERAEESSYPLTPPMVSPAVM
jgi:hypothetical protein